MQHKSVKFRNFWQNLHYAIYEHMPLNEALTLHCLPQEVSSSLFVYDMLIYFSSRDVVITVQCNIQKSFIVPKIKIHFPSIIQNIDFTCNKF